MSDLIVAFDGWIKPVIVSPGSESDHRGYVLRVGSLDIPVEHEEENPFEHERLRPFEGQYVRVVGAFWKKRLIVTSITAAADQSEALWTDLQQLAEAIQTVTERIQERLVEEAASLALAEMTSKGTPSNGENS